MKSRAKTIALGVLALVTLGGCSGSDDAEPPRTAESAGGGLDGGGALDIRLEWSKGVFVQPIWVEGELRCLISNRRAEAVSVGVFESAWPDDSEIADLGPTRGTRLLEAVVPAHTTRTVDATTLLGTSAGEILVVGVDDEELGLMFRPQPLLVPGTLPVISTNWSREAQVETDFSVLPGTSFEATVTLTRPGQLQLRPAWSAGWSTDAVEVLGATDVTSDDAVITTTTDGFLVELSADTSETNPARVQLSFSLPPASGDATVAFDAGVYCVDQGTQGCGYHDELQRLVPRP
jgi:hypothetical protein